MNAPKTTLADVLDTVAGLMQLAAVGLVCAFLSWAMPGTGW